MRKMKKLLIAAVASMTVMSTIATVSYAMPSDVGGTQNGDYGTIPEVPERGYWDGSTARWYETTNAEKYEIQVYRDSDVASTDVTAHTHMVYTSLLKKTGAFRFRVRAISVSGDKSAWSRWSDDHEISGYSPVAASNHTGNSSDGPGCNTYSPSSAKYGWVKSSDGYFWLWKNKDGSYAKDSWKTIDGYWYYFDQAGHMFDGWFSPDYDSSRTYYFYSDGRMATGRQTIDGITHYFNDDPSSPYYGCQQ